MSSTRTLPTHHPEIFRAVQRAVSCEKVGSFSLQDIASSAVWVASVNSDTSHFLVGAALSGALDALRQVDALAVDVEVGVDTPPGAAVRTSDMTLARQWLAEGLRRPASVQADQAAVTNALASRGWLNNSVRITSLILAIYALACRARARARMAIYEASQGHR